MRLLFSEDEWYYRDLGLEDIKGIEYRFGGMRMYRSPDDVLSVFDAFICAYYTMPHNALLTKRYRELGIKTILCSDGIFDFSNAKLNIMHAKYGLTQFHPILQDYFICVGKRESRYFSNGVKAMDYMPKRMISSKELIPLPNKVKVLVTTANTAYFNQDEYVRLLLLMTQSISILIENNVEFAVRIFDQKLMTDISDEFSSRISNDVEFDFETTLKGYSAVITTPSSIAVVSMYQKRPTALLVYRDLPLFMQAGWMIPSAPVLDSFIDDFLRGDSERMKLQNKLYDNYAQEHGLTERIVEVMEDDSHEQSVYAYMINRSYENMLMSRFNFNVEWHVRKIYHYLKSFKTFNNLLGRIKKIIF